MRPLPVPLPVLALELLHTARESELDVWCGAEVQRYYDYVDWLDKIHYPDEVEPLSWVGWL